MEVSSSGDCIEDILKFSLEMAQAFSHETRWWEPLFDRYGREPDFENFKLRLLGVENAELGRSGQWIKGGIRDAVLLRFMNAPTWESLFKPI